MINSELIDKMSKEDLQIYVNTFHVSPDGIGITKMADGTLVKVNKEIQRIIGYSEEELLGKTTVELNIYSLEEREKLISILKAEGKIYEYEVELNTKSGNKITALLYIEFITAGDEAYTVFIVRDITKRLKDENDLRLLQEVVDISTQAIGLGSLDGGIPYMNKAMIKQLGANNLEEVKAHGFLNFYDKKHQEMLNNKIFPILFEKGTWEGELPLTTMQGKKLLTYNQLTLLRDQNGNPELLLNLVDDITEKREQEEQFRIISNSSLDSIIMIDHNSIITFWNPASERIFGYAKDEVIGKDVHQILPSKEYGDNPVIGFNKFKSTDEGPAIGKILELNAIHKNGNVFPIEISVSAINREGNWHAVANIRDITEKKKAAEELEKHRNHLEELVTSRTRALEEQQERLAKYFKAISSLAVDDTFTQGNVKLANDLVVKSAAETLGVSRVGIWLYGENEASIVCATLYEQGKEFNYQRVELSKADFPSYFKALENKRIIDIADAQNNKITAEFNKSYLKPLGITSMLDVPIKAGGKTIGVICHEHTGEKRNWAIEEINFAVSLSELLTKAIDAEKRIQAENELLKAKEKAEENETKLQFINKRFELAAKSGSIGVWDWDIAKNITIWDDIMFDIYQIEKEVPMPYQKWVDRVHSDDINLAEESLNWVLVNKKTGIVEFKIILPDNSIRYIYGATSPLVNEKNEVVRIIGINIDITDRKQMELELKQNERELEYSNQELKRSNEELEQFAYVSSHDLQEPLRKVKNYADLLEKKYKEKLDEKAIKYIDIITNGAGRMQALIDDLLTISRITTRGKEFGIVDVNKVVKDVEDILELKIKSENVKIKYDGLPSIKADDMQLSLLFQNLISNAIKFKGNSAPEIEISAKKNGEFWKFMVKDNGIGIDMQFAERIFVVFQRLHTRQEYSGTGIGLAICKKIIERHGGEIWIDSKLNEGSTFYFTLTQ